MNDKFDSLNNRVEALEVANNARNLFVEPHIENFDRDNEDIVLPRRQNVDAIIPRHKGVYRNYRNHDRYERRDNVLKIKIDAPKFDGRFDPIAFSDWLSSMDKFFDWHMMSEYRMVRSQNMLHSTSASTGGPRVGTDLRLPRL
ncbi:hypothetical protein POM88_037568 [Heracleum sosnowskyi]|uniref:Uncharacterized protein n=1 Tax=Heracleum sosnowskyi TaxID=360622 RepID=A0AAD8MFF7_9APIA|nr:hypothetical protein POM88_037554 [Heracleum sosnowskyi]KAK1371476.1 hypothetical protein POM88_037568 [Heracleum sosnowskyi]